MVGVPSMFHFLPPNVAPMSILQTFCWRTRLSSISRYTVCSISSCRCHANKQLCWPAHPAVASHYLCLLNDSMPLIHTLFLQISLYPGIRNRFQNNSDIPPHTEYFSFTCAIYSYNEFSFQNSDSVSQCVFSILLSRFFFAMLNIKIELLSHTFSPTTTTKTQKHTRSKKSHTTTEQQQQQQPLPKSTDQHTTTTHNTQHKHINHGHKNRFWK